MNDKISRLEELIAEMEALDKRLAKNPLDASAQARWTWLESLFKELTKYD